MSGGGLLVRRGAGSGRLQCGARGSPHSALYAEAARASPGLLQLTWPGLDFQGGI